MSPAMLYQTLCTVIISVDVADPIQGGVIQR